MKPFNTRPEVIFIRNHITGFYIYEKKLAIYQFNLEISVCLVSIACVFSVSFLCCVSNKNISKWSQSLYFLKTIWFINSRINSPAVHVCCIINNLFATLQIVLQKSWLPKPKHYSSGRWCNFWNLQTSISSVSIFT